MTKRFSVFEVNIGRWVRVGLLALLVHENSFGSGIIKLESSGFLRRSEDRADSSSTLSLGPRVDDSGKYIEGKLDVDAIVQVTDNKNLSIDRSAFTIEASNAYIATSKNLMPRHQVTLGRRVYNWSRFDDEWEFGTVSPRFIWDPTQPQTIGLTGAFYSYESRHWRWLSYASPLSIPERGYPIRNEDGRLLSSNPFYNPYYESAVIAKKDIPVTYNVDYPPMNELIFNPGAVTSLRWSSDENGKGVWAQGLYGYLPIHQANIAIDVGYFLQRDDIEVQVHPEIQRHHLLSLETGIDRKRFSLWASATEEIPTARSEPPTWITTPSEPATLLSAGGAVEVLRHWRLKSSYLFVDEKRSPAVENQDFSVELPGRFPFHRAVRGSVEFKPTERMTYEVALIDDLEYESQLVSADITYQILKKDNALTLNLGSDFFASATSKGYIGQYKGNDRFRGEISYAF